ncbi:MAG TPA: helix-turn-helix domain-containing protein [bacterium]|nr:helix-turn-helix domain-containing protein [bacterium]HPN43925.1 helix-turn-helix domain-containing protein [bacterium]
MSVIVTKRLMDAKEASQYLSISRTKLYELLKKKVINSITIDSRRLFDVEDLDMFVNQLKAN